MNWYPGHVSTWIWTTSSHAHVKPRTTPSREWVNRLCVGQISMLMRTNMFILVRGSPKFQFYLLTNNSSMTMGISWKNISKLLQIYFCYWKGKRQFIALDALIRINSIMFTCKKNDLVRNSQTSSFCFLQIGEMNWTNPRTEFFKHLLEDV